MRWPAFRKRPSGWFLAAGVLAAAAAAMTVRAAAAHVSLEPVVVARTDLAVGTRLGGDDRMVGTLHVPKGARLPGMAASVEDLSGRVVVVPVAAGEPITQATLGGHPGRDVAPLANGERAISVPMSAAGAAAALLVPGVLVDAVASPGDQPGVARVVVGGAEVIAQTSAPGAEPGAVEGGAVLLRVSEEQALRLSAVLDTTGGIRLLPRPVDDPDGEAP